MAEPVAVIRLCVHGVWGCVFCKPEAAAPEVEPWPRCACGHRIHFLAMNIVNQLFDLAEVPVDKRQAINDEADDFVYRLLVEHAHNDDGGSNA